MIENKLLMEYLEDDFFNSEVKDNQNDVVQLLDFMRTHGTPLQNYHIEGIFLLKSMQIEGVCDFSDIINYIPTIKQFTSEKKDMFKMIDKLTLADRIRGNAKLSTILKQPTASTNLNMGNMEMREKPIGY